MSRSSTRGTASQTSPPLPSLGVPDTDPGMGGAAANPRGLDTNLKARAQNHEYDAIADRIARDRPRHVLDWGCGWGQMTKRLRNRGIDTDAFDYRGDIEHDGRYSLQHFPEI